MGGAESGRWSFVSRHHPRIGETNLALFPRAPEKFGRAGKKEPICLFLASGIASSTGSLAPLGQLVEDRQDHSVRALDNLGNAP